MILTVSFAVLIQIKDTSFITNEDIFQVINIENVKVTKLYYDLK